MFKKIISLSKPFTNICEGKLLRERVVDPYVTQKFMVNRFGWLTSDISLLLSADNESLVGNIMSRLQVLKGSGDTRSEREMLDSLIPRYCQSFAERSKFMDYVHEKHPEWFVDDSTNKSTVGDASVKDSVSNISHNE